MSGKSPKRNTAAYGLLLAGFSALLCVAPLVSAHAEEPKNLDPVSGMFLGGIALHAEPQPAAAVALPPLGDLAVVRHLIAGYADVADVTETKVTDPIKTGTISEGVFQSVAIPMHNFPAARRWARIRAAIELCKQPQSCGGRNELLSMIDDQSAGQSFLERVRIVNKMVNGLVRYRSDRAAYGVVDHWATPEEILSRGAGDCEDFAILKMTALIREGVPERSLSLVVLRDTRHQAFHAVLAVSTSEGRYILDNTIADVVRDETLPNYQPLYSFSTDRAWVHGSRSPKPYASASISNFASIAPGEGIIDIK